MTLDEILTQKIADFCIKKGKPGKIEYIYDVVEKTLKLYEKWKKELKPLNVPFAGNLCHNPTVNKKGIDIQEYIRVLHSPYSGLDRPCKNFTNLNEVLDLIGRKDIIHANQGYTFDLDKGIYKKLFEKAKKKWEDEKKALAVTNNAKDILELYEKWKNEKLYNGKSLKELGVNFTARLGDTLIAKKNGVDGKKYSNALKDPYGHCSCSFTNLDEVLDLIGDKDIIKANGRFLIETDFDRKIYEKAKNKWKDEKKALAVTENAHDIVKLYGKWKKELKPLNVPFAVNLHRNYIIKKKGIDVKEFMNVLGSYYGIKPCNFTNFGEVLDLIKDVNPKKYDQINKARQFIAHYSFELGNLFEKSVYCALKAVNSDWETYNGNREIKHRNCMPDLSKDSLENISKNGRIVLGDIKTTPDYGGKKEKSVETMINKYTTNIDSIRKILNETSEYMLTPVKCDSGKKDVLWIYHLNGKHMPDKEVNGVEVKYKDIFSYLGNKLEKEGRKDIVNFWQYMKDNMLYNECPENEKKLGILKTKVDRLLGQYNQGNTSEKFSYKGWLRK